MTPPTAALPRTVHPGSDYDRLGPDADPGVGRTSVRPMRARCDWCGMDVEVLASGRCLLGHPITLIHDDGTEQPFDPVLLTPPMEQEPPAFPGAADVTPTRGRVRKPYKKPPPRKRAEQPTPEEIARSIQTAPTPPRDLKPRVSAPPADIAEAVEESFVAKVSRPWAPVEPDGPSGPLPGAAAAQTMTAPPRTTAPDRDLQAYPEPHAPVTLPFPEPAAKPEPKPKVKREGRIAALRRRARHVEPPREEPSPFAPPPVSGLPPPLAEPEPPPPPPEPEPEPSAVTKPRARSKAKKPVMEDFFAVSTPSASAPPLPLPKKGIDSIVEPAGKKKSRSKPAAFAPAPAADEAEIAETVRPASMSPRNTVAWALAIAATFVAGVAALFLSPQQEQERPPVRKIALEDVPGYSVRRDTETETRLRAALAGEGSPPRQIHVASIITDSGDVVAQYEAIVFPKNVSDKQEDINTYLILFAEGAGISGDAFTQRPIGRRSVWSGLLPQGQAILLFRGPEVVIVITAEIGADGDKVADAILTARGL